MERAVKVGKRKVKKIRQFLAKADKSKIVMRIFRVRLNL